MSARKPAGLTEPARGDLQRSAPFTLTRATKDDGPDGFTMEGDAAVFNTPTVIDSWEGRFKEILLPGCFKKTLRERTPRLQFDHGSHPLIGSLPIGRLTKAYEDGDRAVHVEARLSDNWLVQPVRDAIAEESIDGMSFRFTVVREEWRNPDDKVLTVEEVLDLLWSSGGVSEDQLITRYIKELKCPELGPVVWPAYEATSVGVRSNQKITIDLGRLDRPEQRSALARAVMLADLAERSDTDDSDAAAPPTDGHSDQAEESRDDAPPPDGHPSDAEQDPYVAFARRTASHMTRLKDRSTT